MIWSRTSTKKGQDGNILIKFDMFKAFDRLCSSYLIRVMCKFAFCQRWCDLVFRCISNVWYSVQWQGNLYGYFTSSRGVRQGNPLSSILFVLAMEWFSRAINKSVSDGTLQAYITNRGAIQINHLLYEDDILFFAKDGKQNIESLMALLDKFWSGSKS